MATTAHSRPPMAHASQKYGVSYSGTNSMTKPAMVATIMMQAHNPLVSWSLRRLRSIRARARSISSSDASNTPSSAQICSSVYIARRAAASEFTITLPSSLSAIACSRASL